MADLSTDDDVTVLHMKPLRLADRLWYRRLGVAGPELTGSTGPRHAGWVRLLPYRWRTVHRAYAAAFGFFWLPCVLCDRSFGGHEAGESIPDPLSGPGRGVVICSRCTHDRAAGIP